jgi:hypothetical protein
MATNIECVNRDIGSVDEMRLAIVTPAVIVDKLRGEACRAH